MSGDARLRSHSFIKSIVVRLMLLGVSLFSACGSRSSSLLGLEGDDTDGGDGERARRVLESFFLLFRQEDNINR